MTPYIHQLFIYPIDLMQGVYVKNIQIGQAGFINNGVFHVCKADGSPLDESKRPILSQMIPDFHPNGIEIAFTQQKRIIASYQDFSATMMPDYLSNKLVKTKIAPISVNQFLSDILNEDAQLRLLYKHQISHNYRLINLNSLHEQKVTQTKSFLSLKGHIVIQAPPFIENEFQVVKIGDVTFDVINQRDNEFVKLVIAREQGQISVGDKIEVLKLRQIFNQAIKSQAKNEEQNCIITFGKHTFTGNKKQPILDQLEQQGIDVPSSCRSGICKRCFITLESGSVAELASSGKQNNQILACSCIPSSDIVLSKAKVKAKK